MNPEILPGLDRLTPLVQEWDMEMKIMVRLSHDELSALDECTLAFAEQCNPHDPEERKIRNDGLIAIEKLSRAFLDAGE